MKKIVLIIILFIIVFFPLYSESKALILRRVFLSPVESEVKEKKELFDLTPEILYSLITKIQPVIRVDKREEAKSIITTQVEIENQLDIKIMIELYEGDNRIDISETIFPITSFELKDIKTILENTAKQFYPYLGKVEPEIRISTLIRDEETRKIIDKINFKDMMAKPYEIGLWFGGLSKYSAREGDNFAIKSKLLFPSPIILDFNWFLEKRKGILFSLYFDYSDYMHFDEVSLSQNTYILPGIGYVYRNLGRFSTGFSASLYLGGTHVHAIEDICWIKNDGVTQGLSLSPGESEWVLFSYLSLRFTTSFNISPKFSIKTSTAIFLNPLSYFSLAGIFDYYSWAATMVNFPLLNIGISYRL